MISLLSRSSRLMMCMLVASIAFSYVAPPATAQDILNLPQSTSGVSLLAGNDEFLPVEEAFRLYPSVNGQLLRLTWDIADNYYLYEERFRLRTDTGTAFTPQFSAGITKYDEFFNKEMTVFYHGTTLTLDLTGIAETFNLLVESQGCADAGLCYPPYTQVVRVDPQAAIAAVLSAEALTETPTFASGEQNAFAPTSGSGWLLQALFLALLGGIILNLMPCVFPVLSIKVMSLAQADAARLPLHGWVYTAGIVLSFVIFAAALLVARMGGEAIGWGFQLQSPLLITGLVYLFFIMGLSLSGLIHFGSRWMGAGQNLTQKSGLSGSFFTGVLAAVVASPCTAPFMGAALGFALTQPAIVSLSIFAALGLGMALPLLLLCYIPALAHRLPRPGAWMETFKELLAFPLYLTALWLLWVLGRQTSVDTLVVVGAGAVAIAFGFWMAKRPASGKWKWLKQAVIISAWVVAVWAPMHALTNPPQVSRWQPYSPELLASLRAEGKPVFVNLTADWCLTCLANERFALNTDEVDALFNELQVVTLKGDWTNTDPHITQLLNEYGRSGVPLYLWFPGGQPGKAEILPQLLTPASVIAALTATD
jgi:thiol:disulfide interchange protein